MNYRKIYEDIIHRATNRIIEGYTEIHHITPRCVGGSDEKDNLVELTPEEHYIAHQLLVKMYPEEPKLVYAAMMMRPNRPSNKIYGWLKRKFIKNISKQNAGAANPNYGKIWITEIETGISKLVMAYDEIPDNYIVGRNKKIKSCPICKSKFFKATITCSKECEKIKKSISSKTRWKDKKKQPEENKKRKSREYKHNAEKHEEMKLLAISLFELFKLGKYRSVSEFCRLNDISISRMTLSIYWRKYIPEYCENSSEGKAFSSV